MGAGGVKLNTSVTPFRTASLGGDDPAASVFSAPPKPPATLPPKPRSPAPAAPPPAPSGPPDPNGGRRGTLFDPENKTLSRLLAPPPPTAAHHGGDDDWDSDGSG